MFMGDDDTSSQNDVAIYAEDSCIVMDGERQTRTDLIMSGWTYLAYFTIDKICPVRDIFFSHRYTGTRVLAGIYSLQGEKITGGTFTDLSQDYLGKSRPIAVDPVTLQPGAYFLFFYQVGQVACSVEPYMGMGKGRYLTSGASGRVREGSVPRLMLNGNHQPGWGDSMLVLQFPYGQGAECPDIIDVSENSNWQTGYRFPWMAIGVGAPS